MCNQRKKILAHLYSTHIDAYKALPRHPFEKSDQNSTLQIPAYKQKLKQKVPVTHSIRKWSDDADASLQDCFASTDWNMFGIHPMALRNRPPQSSASSISVLMTSSPQWLYVHIPIWSHGLQATSASSWSINESNNCSGWLCDTGLGSQCETIKQANIHKAAGPDGLPGCVLKACADQL